MAPTSGTFWSSPVATAVPHTPRPTGIRVCSVSRPENASSTSSPVSCSMYAYADVYGAPRPRSRSHGSCSRSAREASRRCAARSARTIGLVWIMQGYLSLARPPRKPVDVDPSPRPHPRCRGDQPRSLGRSGCRGAPALPRYDGNDPRGGARRPRSGDRDRRRDVRGKHAPQSDLLAVRRGADHRGAVRLGRGARGAVPKLLDSRAGGARARGDRVADIDAHFLLCVRVHDHRRHRADDRPRPGARPAAPGGVLLRELRVRLWRQGRDLRPGDVGAARPAAPHRRAVPLGAPRHRRGVTGGRLHPFTLLAIAGTLPALAWILPAPAGAAATLAVALVLTLTPGAGLSPGLRPGLVVLRTVLLTAAPFWVFLLLLHDVATTVAIGLRITTMVASFVWLVAALEPARLVEAMVAAGWSASVAYVFGATLSAVPVLKARARRIVEAQRARGLSARGGIAARLRALRALALPLVLSALHEVDERALALETRGLVPGIRRTPLAPPPDTPAERAARWALLLVCLFALFRRFL